MSGVLPGGGVARYVLQCPGNGVLLDETGNKIAATGSVQSCTTLYFLLLGPVQSFWRGGLLKNREFSQVLLSLTVVQF